MVISVIAPSETTINGMTIGEIVMKRIAIGGVMIGGIATN
jgi:hypothetical protein